MKEIPLSQNKIALVDDDDFERLSTFNWYYCNNGYARTDIWENNKKRCVLMHRLLTDFSHKSLGEVDHINRNKLDNRKSNLRLTSHSNNRANSKKPKRKNTTSKYKGVRKRNNTDRWEASIRVRGRYIYLGLFKNELDAAMAYDKAALEHFGEFAYTNFEMMTT